MFVFCERKKHGCELDALIWLEALEGCEFSSIVEVAKEGISTPQSI